MWPITPSGRCGYQLDDPTGKARPSQAHGLWLAPTRHSQVYKAGIETHNV